MRLTRHFPKDYKSLQQLVHQAARETDTIVMQAGHFLLYYDQPTGKIIPCIPEALNDPRHAGIRDDYAQFPLLTWCLGLRLLASISASSKRIMVAVNDWQHVPKTANRADFYSAHAQLPASYAEELTQYSDSITLFEPKRSKPNTGTAPFFGEMNLRNRYQRHVSKLVAADTLPRRAILDFEYGTKCSFPDWAGVPKEVYCSDKTGDCAGEIAEMIYDASSRAGATCVINLYPLVCREFVEFGSQLAVDLLGSTCKTVLNLGFQSTSVRDSNHLIETTEATLHQWNMG